MGSVGHGAHVAASASAACTIALPTTVMPPNVLARFLPEPRAVPLLLLLLAALVKEAEAARRRGRWESARV